MQFKRYVIVALSTLSILSIPSVSFGWGKEGHETIAYIANANLTPSARQAIDRLLAQEPGETLVSISTWVDQNRNRETAKWHFINFPYGNCKYDPVRDCPDGQCVVEAIKRQNAILHSRSSDQERLTALKYLVHFVGDVAQPLHAGFYEDKGGNEYQIDSSTRSRNLHALWDSGMLEEIDHNPESLSLRVMRVARVDDTVRQSPEQWAMESCRIVQTNGFYPRHKVSNDYIERYAPVAESQLYKAGMRLAKLLNDLR